MNTTCLKHGRVYVAWAAEHRRQGEKTAQMRGRRRERETHIPGGGAEGRLRDQRRRTVPQVWGAGFHVVCLRAGSVLIWQRRAEFLIPAELENNMILCSLPRSDGQTLKQILTVVLSYSTQEEEEAITWRVLIDKSPFRCLSSRGRWHGGDMRCNDHSRNPCGVVTVLAGGEINQSRAESYDAALLSCVSSSVWFGWN